MSELIERLIERVNELAERVGNLERLEYPSILSRYSTDAGQSIPDSVATIVNFEDITYDPDSLVTMGAAWHFTAATAGYYSVAAMIMFAATTTWADTEDGAIYLYKNGAVFSQAGPKGQLLIGVERIYGAGRRRHSLPGGRRHAGRARLANERGGASITQ
jgi:hypothetical protein